MEVPRLTDEQADAALFASLDASADSPVVDEVTVAEASLSAPPKSVWQRLREAIFPNASLSPEQAQARLAELDEAVSLHPDDALPFVLRGELFLNLRAYPLAARDFETALELAQQDVNTGDWGIVGQVLQDRALRGLQRTRRHIAPQET